MRTRICLLFIIPVLIMASQGPAVTAAQTTTAPAVVELQPGDAQAALKTLQEAVTIDNRYKVVTLFDFPLQAWAGGRQVTIRNLADFQSRYRQIFDDAMREALAAAQPDALTTDAQGIWFGKGLLLCRAVGSKGTPKFVAINEPGKLQ
jgi:hypothetical protein